MSVRASIECVLCCAIALALAAVGCGGEPPPALDARDAARRATPDAGTSDAGNDDALRAQLRELTPDELPAPLADPSNAFADDARAAALGQRLFFDPGYSGALLDGDNDGSEHALG